MSRSSHGAILLDSVLYCFRNPKVLLLLVGAFLTVQLMQHPLAVLPAFAQTEKDPALVDDEPGATDFKPSSTGGGRTKGSDDAEVKQRGWIDAFKAGGTIGAIIILLSFAAVGLVVEHSLSLREKRIMPEPVLADLEQLIAQGRIQEGIDYCYEPRNASLATDVVLAGLERFKSSEFGFAEYKSACEEAGEEGTARLYRKIDMLNLIGVIAPMLGLLGTVQGMIEAFNVLASSKGAAKPYELADSISKALVTTFEGLVVAIPAMVAYSFFRSQIDHLVSETGKRVERIMSPLSRRK